MKKAIVLIILLSTVCSKNIFGQDEVIENFSTNIVSPFISTILYDNIKVEIPDSYKQYLDMVVLQMMFYPEKILVLKSYSSIEIEANLSGKLCEQRLNLLKEFFYSKGVLTNKIKVENINIHDQIASNELAEGRIRNNCIIIEFQ
jgi:hypothetical protein